MQPADLSTSHPLWRVVHAKAVGTAHLSSGTPCQDAVGWLRLPSGILAVALADGAGSASMSETGANLSVTQALAWLEDSPANQTPADMKAWGIAVKGAFHAALKSIQLEAQVAGLEPGAFACTLICLVAAKDGLVVGQVGDGAVVARTPDGDLYTLSQPQRGEYANETLFLTMPDAVDKGVFQAVELDLSGFAVMSDGLIRLALQLPGYSPHDPFFTPLWSFAARAESTEQADRQLAQFLASERVCSRTDDDKSLVIAVDPQYEFNQPKSNHTDPEA